MRISHVRVLSLMLVGLFCLISSPRVSAQMRQVEGDAFLKKAGLRLGGLLPDKTGYDLDGDEIALRDLKGSYTVLVTGCMT